MAQRAKAKKVLALNKHGDRRGDPIYCSDMDELAYNYCLLSAIDDDLAEFFGVTTMCIKKWRKEHPSFREACEKGKTVADMKVALATYNKATGFSHRQQKPFCSKDGEKIVVEYEEYFPPDTRSQELWLRNRSKRWTADKSPNDSDTPQSITFNFSTVPDKPYVEPADPS